MAQVKHIFGKAAVAFCAALILAYACAQTVFADAVPLVTAFTASSPSINNGYAELLTWTASNSTGSSLYVSCPLGVTLKKSTGAAFSCDTRQAYSTNGSDSVSFVVTNVSGFTRQITATVYPKNSAGADYDAGAKTASFYVATSPQPIIDFSPSTTSVASGASVTLTWRGVDTSGTNIQFDCVTGIQITATSPAVAAPLACGVPAFSTVLPQSGSVTVTAVNSSLWPATLIARVLPVISAGSYDGTRSLSAAFTVAGKPPNANPSVTDFKSSQTAVVPGVPFTLSWATKDAAGVSIQIPCTDSGGNGISIQSVVGTTSVPLSCGTSAFTAALPSTGSTTIAILNKLTRIGAGSVAVLLFPQDSTGTYLGTLAQTLNLNILAAAPVLAATVPVSPYQGVSVPASAATPAVVPPPQTASQSASHYTFTKPLRRGSRNADVTALQTFLAHDPNIYPEGLVTGYFGALSEKAVGLFQEKYGVAKKGEDGYGTVGPKTRAKLNAVQ